MKNKKISIIIFIVLFIFSFIIFILKINILPFNLVPLALLWVLLIAFIYKSPYYRKKFFEFRYSESFIIAGLYPKLLMISYILFPLARTAPFPKIIYFVGFVITSATTGFLITEYKKRPENRIKIKIWLFFASIPLIVNFLSLIK